MNSELIKVVEKDGIETVSARELHEFLESRQDFSDWIKKRISKYGFEEEKDYTIILGNRSDGLAGKPRKEYHISIDMAKELSMVENNVKGKEARKYFIAREKQAKDLIKELGRKPPSFLPDFTDPAISARAWAEQFEGREYAEKEVKVLQVAAVKDAPKVSFYDAAVKANKGIPLSVVAKNLGIPGFGQNNLFRYLRKVGVLMPSNEPYQSGINAGHFIVAMNTFTDTLGREHTSFRTRATVKGEAYILKLLRKDGLYPVLETIY